MLIFTEKLYKKVAICDKIAERAKIAIKISLEKQTFAELSSEMQKF